MYFPDCFLLQQMLSSDDNMVDEIQMDDSFWGSDSMTFNDKN